MNDPHLRRHAFGFLEVVDRSMPEVLSDYYAQAYFQNEASSRCQKSYFAEELEVIELRIARRVGQAGIEASNRFYSALVDVGFGRNPTAFFRPKP